MTTFEEVHGHVWACRAVAVDTERRTIEALVVPYGEAVRVSDDGGANFYTESFERGGALTAERAAVYGSHRVTRSGIERGPLIGRASEWTDTDDGLRGVLTIARTAAGDEVLELADVLGEIHVSAEYKLPSPAKANSTVVRNAQAPVTIDGIAIVLPPQRPAYSGAVGTARTEPEETPVTITETEPAEVETETGRAAIDEAVRRAISRMNIGGATTTARVAHPLERFDSFDSLTTAARSGPVEEQQTLSRVFATTYERYRDAVRTGRALVDQITPDNPGVMQSSPTWLTEVFGLIDSGRPSITALGGPRSAGTSGLDIYWPYIDVDLTTLVGVQSAEKTEITSVKVPIKRASETLETYAGGSDVSLQLIRRSSPGYLAIYENILQRAYGMVTDDRFITDLVNLSGRGHVAYTFGTDTDGKALQAALFAASAEVAAATGSPATAVIAASDVFVKLGGVYTPSAYGTSNLSGTAQANTLAINVSGLSITMDPLAPNGTLIVTNEMAARWVEDGPFLITDLDVAKLGQDVAIWGLGVTVTPVPAGVVQLSATAPALMSADSKSK